MNANHQKLLIMKMVLSFVSLEKEKHSTIIPHGKDQYFGSKYQPIKSLIVLYSTALETIEIWGILWSVEKREDGKVSYYFYYDIFAKKKQLKALQKLLA